MDRLIPLEKACVLMGVHPNTVRAWEGRGQIRIVYSLGGKRRVPESEILRLSGAQVPPEGRKVALYARVSSQEQKRQGDLDRQVRALRTHAQLKTLPEEDVLVVTDVGSGLSDKRRGLERLLKLARDRAVQEIHVAHRDRLSRFGFGLLEAYFGAFGVRIVVHGTTEPKEAHQELVEDLVSLVTSFSGRLYGLRSHAKARALVEAVKEAVAH